jgi:DNA-binding PadR family transcriptional regulator
MTRKEIPTAAEAQLPLRPIDLQILLVLMESNLHGYGLMKEVERQSGGRVTLEVGSLYRVIKRLLANELIGEADGAPEQTDAKRRRNYRITEFGRQVARAEAERLVAVIETAQQRKLLEGGKRA